MRVYPLRIAAQVRPSDPVRPEFALPRAPFVDSNRVVHITRYRDIVEVTELERAGCFSRALSVLLAALRRHGHLPPERVHIAWLFPWAQGAVEADGSLGRHKVLSGVLRHYLKRRAVIELTPVVVLHARDLLRDHVRAQLEHGGPCGVIDVAAFASALAFRSMSSLAGFPQTPADEQFMVAQLQAFANRPDLIHAFEPEDPAVREYFARVVHDHDPQAGGLLGEIIAAHARGTVSVDERDALIWGCWAAGSDTTATLINLLVGLVDQAGLGDVMVEHLDDAGRAWRARAINEALRFTPFAYSPAVAVGDVRLKDGFLIPDGSQVELHWESANRDPEVFGDDAGVFDPERDAASPNLAFGRGIHHCLGEPLARAEADVAAVALFGNLPGLRVIAWERTPKVVDLVTTNRAKYDVRAAARCIGLDPRVKTIASR
jgi:cytochrome P450